MGKQLREPGRVAKFFAVTALILALLAFVLGSAPFTPAIVLTYLAIPMAILSMDRGAWRISTMALYFSVSAFQTTPIPYAFNLRSDLALPVLALAGVILSLILITNYVPTRTARRLSHANRSED